MIRKTRGFQVRDPRMTSINGTTGAAASGGGASGALFAPRRRRRGATLALGALAALALAACEPIVRVHGYAPAEAQLAQLEPGIDSAATVTAKIGRPSTAGVMRNDAWYYVSSRVETLAYNAPEVTERRVVAIRFDDQGTLASTDLYGLEEGRVINLVTRTTPTFGRELTILQQVFGNLANAGSAVAEGATNN